MLEALLFTIVFGTIIGGILRALGRGFGWLFHKVVHGLEYLFFDIALNALLLVLDLIRR